MKSCAHVTSELVAGAMTATDGTMDVTARLAYRPSDPYVIIMTITDRAGAVHIWTIGRDLLLASLIAEASCPVPDRVVMSTTAGERRRKPDATEPARWPAGHRC